MLPAIKSEKVLTQLTETEYKLPSFGGVTPNMSQGEERENERGRK